MKLKLILIITVLIASADISCGQLMENPPPPVAIPTVGQPVPYFEAKNIAHFKSKTATIKDFKGKWLIMDFWFSACRSCMMGFPKMNEIQERFPDKVQVMLMGTSGRQSNYVDGIERLYEKLRVRQHLTIPSSFDSLLADSWGIYSMPYIMIIDPAGIIREITTGWDMSADKIGDLIAGRPVSFIPMDRGLVDFEASNVINSKLKEEDIVYNSTLLRWRKEYRFLMPVDSYIANEKKPGFKTAMTSLRELYNLAYFGKWNWQDRDPDYDKIYPMPLLELKDTSSFFTDFDKGIGYFNYSLIIPEERYSKAEIMKALRDQLNTTFGYEASIEKRKVKVIRLIASPVAVTKLKTKGGVGRGFVNDGASGGLAGLNYFNDNVKGFLKLIMAYTTDHVTPYLDGTGITTDIDINFDALLTDKAEIHRELRKNGLDLIFGEKEMEVVVIRDGTNRKIN